ncbi:MAG: alpha-ketoglutarate-dependent taurine dioxygenase [Arenicella sp.]|jgi:alpha-ketoglutarate-dependent taurine dioxygenase
MKLLELNNAYKVQDLDINDDDACRELGVIVADKCVIFLDQPLDEKRLYEIQTLWGSPSRSLMHEAVSEQKLQGSHWRELLLNLSYITSAARGFQDGMSRVSYAKNKRGKPTGIFTNGELNWHCDQQSCEQQQRIIGLTSLFGSVNSQTSFLCSARVYESLNHDDRTMVDELISVYKWDGGSMSKDLIPSQMEIIRYNMVPVDGMECALLDQTANGRKGIKFPSHSFHKFRGLSEEESDKFKRHLWSKLNKPENIYTHNWQDGQTVFMDQNITLHARPTNVKDGDTRTMARMVSFLDKLYPNQLKDECYLWKGEKLGRDEFIEIIDRERKQLFFEETGIA